MAPVEDVRRDREHEATRLEPKQDSTSEHQTTEGNMEEMGE